MTPGLHYWPTPLEAFDLVASPKLGLQHMGSSFRIASSKKKSFNQIDYLVSSMKALHSNLVDEITTICCLFLDQVIGLPLS
jgi:hypothetical protein